MPTISQLTATYSLTDTDQLPVYSTNNGDARKASLSTLKAYLLSTTATGVLSVTATAPIVSSGGDNPNISIPAASGLNDGYLAIADWNTFNNKQAALVSGTNLKTVGGVSLLGSGDVGTLGANYGGTGITAPGTAGNILTSNGAGGWTSSAPSAGVSLATVFAIAAAL